MDSTSRETGGEPPLHEAAWGYQASAATYERGRPGYAPDAIAAVVAAFKLGPGKRVADVGAGTGKLTRQLTGTGADIVAVEPVAEMRAQFAAVLPDVPILEGRAEALPLPDASLDGMVAGQAWHWFDANVALGEAARVLVSGGGLVLVWNDYDMSVPWVRELAQIRDRYAPPDRSSSWKDVFTGRPDWTPLEEQVFSHEHRTTRDALVDRVLSTSVIAALSPEEREAVRREVLEVLDRYEETRGRDKLLVPYRTEVHWTFRR